MTQYDGPGATDGHGGPHRLAGIPQDVLDAATSELAACLDFYGIAADEDTTEEIAHSILLSAVVMAEDLARRRKRRPAPTPARRGTRRG